jgi:hypothetical protein
MHDTIELFSDRTGELRAVYERRSAPQLPKIPRGGYLSAVSMLPLGLFRRLDEWGYTATSAM